MFDTISRYLHGIPDNRSRLALRTMLGAIGDRLSSQAFNSGALAIKAGGSAVPKSVSTVYYVAGGQHASLAAGDLTLSTANNISAGKYNVICFFVDVAGTVTPTNGKEASTAAGVIFPQPLAGQACIGYLMEIGRAHV